MSVYKLRRRDAVNHGSVSCPSGATYNVDDQACVEVTSEADCKALMEVGRPPLFMRQAGHDQPGFWQLLSANGVPTEELPIAPAPVVPAPAPGQPNLLPGPADPVAVKVLGPTLTALAEAAIFAEEAPAPASKAAATPASVPAASKTWREAKATSANKSICAGVKLNGQACKAKAQSGSAYCVAHRKQEKK